MWIYFDGAMVASTRIYDTPIRQGDVGDEIFVVFQNYNNFTGKYVTLQIEYPDHTVTPEVYMTVGTKQYTLNSNGYFVKNTTYTGAGYTFTDPDWFTQYGIHKITIRVYTEGPEGEEPAGVKATGLFGFNVEKTAFIASPNITLNQYNYLLSVVQAKNIIYFNENAPDQENIFDGMYWYKLVI
jgi:hypothetical protein